MRIAQDIERKGEPIDGKKTGDGSTSDQFSDRLLPVSQIAGWLSPIRRFLKLQATSGLLLVAATAFALMAANSPWSEQFLHIWETSCFIGFGDYVLKKDFLHVINDGLMTIFSLSSA